MPSSRICQGVSKSGSPTPRENSVYLISGGYDLLVTLEGKSLKEVSTFVSDKLSTLDTVCSLILSVSSIPPYGNFSCFPSGPLPQDPVYLIRLRQFQKTPFFSALFGNWQREQALDWK